jgi:heparanase 1
MNHSVRILSGAPIFTVDPHYQSVDLDWWTGEHDGSGGGWAGRGLLDLDLSNKRLRHLAAALSPGYLRLGGSLDDVVKYDMSPDGARRQWCNSPTEFRHKLWHLCLNQSRWAQINDFAASAGLELVFGLSYPVDASGNFNISQASELLRHSRAQGYPIAALELGEEMAPLPSSHQFKSLVDGYRSLRALAKSLYPDAKILGPCVGMTDEDNTTAAFGFMRAFLNATIGNGLPEPLLDGVCMHSYNNDGGDNWRRPGFLAQTGRQAAGMLHEIRKHTPPAGTPTPLWCGECGPHNFGGIANKTDRFFSSLWYIDALGGLASSGVHEFGRQSLVGSHYALVDYDRGFAPNPDYWVALMWTKLMGPEVLRVVGKTSDLHVYAARRRGSAGGEVALAWSNINETMAYNLQVILDGTRGPQRGAPSLRPEWHFTASSLSSASVLLNGVALTMGGDALPPLPPRMVSTREPIAIAPLSWGMVIL